MNLLKFLPSFTDSKILVVGDVMLDRYLHGDTSRISPEAPVPVVHVKEIEERLGGAANVAVNIASLGAKATLLGIVGDDHEADKVTSMLGDRKIDCQLCRTNGLPTITKLRVIGRNQQLLRCDFEEKFHHDNADYDPFIEAFKRLVKEHDLVLFSDYAKGTLVPIKELIAEAKKAKVPVLVDPKSKDFNIYSGATIITPNWGEFEAVAGECSSDSEIEKKAQKLLKKYDIESMLVTRGAHGMSLVSKTADACHIPAIEAEIYDVTGAGDTVIATLASSLAAGVDLPSSMYLANVAASIVVCKQGTASVTADELQRALNSKKQQSFLDGIMDEDTLVAKVEKLKASGQKIVMTNGCFDILHPGHAIYMEKAKQLGDILIVAINDDDSVRRLKGPTRPINDLKQRMAMLSALASVDFVFPFSEDTPARVIARVSPDILVKGGDYKIEEIAGHEHVFAHGGNVLTIPLEDGFSTTNMIEKINKENK